MSRRFSKPEKLAYLTAFAFAAVFGVVLFVIFPDYKWYGVVFALYLAFIMWRRMTIHRSGVGGMFARERSLQTYRAPGKTILVELLDADGNDLPPEEAKRKLAAAELTAGPQDVVMGVRKRPAT